mgnify:FL=1
MSVDDEFYDRADEHIHLANQHLDAVSRGKVSASFMYAVSRFNAWVSASGFSNGDEMAASKDETVEYFVAQYRAMLTENMDDYISNFDRYMRQQE